MMRKLLLLVCCVFVMQVVEAKPKYKIVVVTKDKKSHRGVFQSISDSTIVLKTNKGNLETFRAPDIKHLNVYKPHTVLYCGLVGAAAAGVAASTENYDLAKTFYMAFGIPLGMGVGMLSGQGLNDKVTYKEVKMNDFFAVRPALSKYTQEEINHTDKYSAQR